MPDPWDFQTLLRGPFDLENIRRLFGLHVAGVEVTQAIQYHDASAHLTDPADRGADNAVTLVAGKPAWVRVYVRSGAFGGDVAGVTATLTVKRRVDGLFYETIATLAPHAPGSITAHRNPAYAAERAALGATLNFVIPADAMCGNLLLHVAVTSSHGGDVFDVHLDVTLRQTLRLRGIMIGYNGPQNLTPNAPNLTLAAPTLADLQSTSSWALLAFPVESAATYSSGGTLTLTQPLTDPPSCPGCCTTNWVALNAQVAAQVVADGNHTDVLYYGMLATGVPRGPIIGCESAGVSVGGAGDGVTMAHELGHHCGFPHAPCGSVGTPDATYPAYEPYDPANTPQASIGEYGLDISNGNIMSPALFKDMMSYCGPKWISLHNYGKLLNNDKLDPRRSCVDHWWWREYVLWDPGLIPEKWLPDPPPDPWEDVRDVDPIPLISIIGVLHGPDELEITSVMRVETRPGVLGGRAGELSAVLLGGDGERLAAAPLHELRAQACGCGGDAGGTEGRYPCVVQALVPDPERGAALAIRRGEDELWSRRAPSRRPKVGELAARLSGEQLTLTWDADTEGDVSEAWVQWSADRGRTWQALATGLSGGKAVLDAAHLPAGAVTLRLLLGDGFHTTTSKVARVKVPERPPAVSILTPREGETLLAGATMRLWAAVTPAQDAEAEWLLDGERVADGLDAYVPAPPRGKHKLELRVAGPGGKASATTSFRTIELKRRDG